jgi:tRNA(fMet)-specific endonuclease VapC
VEVIRTLLDTSAYSAHLRGHPGVKELVRAADEIYVSAVVLGELRSGFMKGHRARDNEAILREFLGRPRVRLAVIDDETSRRYAVIHDYLRRRGTPVAPNDLWIAASASQHGLRLLTTDRDFQKVPQVVVDYVEPA